MPGPGTRRLERRLFLLLLLLVLATFVFLVADHRLPRGHDVFLNYSAGYFGMCHASQGGGSIYWNPYLAQGNEPASNIPMALLPAIWPSTGRWFSGMNCLVLYYVGYLFSELLLLTGTWLLARRLFADPRTAFFVSGAVLGANLWIDFFGNVGFIAPFPLLLCWLFEFLERGNRLKLFLASHLVSLQLVASYAAILLLVATVIFFAVHALVFPVRWRIWIRAWKPRWTDLGWAVGIGSAVLLPLAAYHQSPDLVTASVGRSTTGSVGLDSFLTYGGLLNPLRFLDAPAGLSPSLDVTLFCGTLTAGLAVLALALRPTREVFHLVAAGLLLLLLSTGFLGLVAPLAYVSVPGMGYFRHVHLAAPFVRFLLAFVAGYAFERLILGRLEGDRRIAAAAGASAALAAALAVLSFLPRETLGLSMKFLETGHPGFSFRHDMTAGPWGNLLLVAASLAAAALATALWLARSGRPGFVPLLVLAVSTVHGFGWKFSMINLKTVRMTPEQQAMQTIGPLPYLSRRTEDPTASARFASLAPALWPYGTRHGLSDPYFFMDLPVPSARITSWQRPLDDLLRSWAGPTPVWSENRLRLPDSHPAIPRVVGLSTDKLQVFRRAHAVPLGEETARALRHPDFRGDLLFVPGTGAPPADLSADDRLPSPCEVVEFDAHRLTVRTEAPEGAWLAYADVWHPRWRATVNGRPVAVERANLAYKAVPLRSGANEVTFRFEPPARQSLHRIMAGVVLFWFGLTGFLVIRAGAGR